MDEDFVLDDGNLVDDDMDEFIVPIKGEEDEEDEAFELPKKRRKQTYTSIQRMEPSYLTIGEWTFSSAPSNGFKVKRAKDPLTGFHHQCRVLPVSATLPVSRILDLIPSSDWSNVKVSCAKDVVQSLLLLRSKADFMASVRQFVRQHVSAREPPVWHRAIALLIAKHQVDVVDDVIACGAHRSVARHMVTMVVTIGSLKLMCSKGSSCVDMINECSEGIPQPVISHLVEHLLGKKDQLFLLARLTFTHETVATMLPNILSASTLQLSDLVQLLFTMTVNASTSLVCSLLVDSQEKTAHELAEILVKRDYQTYSEALLHKIAVLYDVHQLKPVHILRLCLENGYQHDEAFSEHFASVLAEVYVSDPKVVDNQVLFDRLVFLAGYPHTQEVILANIPRLQVSESKANGALYRLSSRRCYSPSLLSYVEDHASDSEKVAIKRAMKTHSRLF